MPPELNTDIPHSARIYDYLLGGKDNFAVDRAAADEMLKHTPSLPISMRANRRFMIKVARYLAGQGLRQFLDVGTGIPTQPNLHEVVQGAAPESAVVYVDNDPLVLVHARALLTPAGTGAVSYLDADLRDPDAIIDRAADTLDLSRPVALTLIAVLQHVTDDEDARRIIVRLMDRLAPGSALALSTVTTENDPDAGERTVTTYNRSGVPAVSRPRSAVEALFAGFHLVDPPGVLPVHHWMPTPEDLETADKDVYMYGGVAFKL
jgi:hypothetical protein